MFLAAVSGLLASCTHFGGDRIHGVSELLENKNEYLGELVSVKGYLRFSPSSRNLWESRRAHANFDNERNVCISVFDIVPNIDRLNGPERTGCHSQRTLRPLSFERERIYFGQMQ